MPEAAFDGVESAMTPRASQLTRPAIVGPPAPLEPSGRTAPAATLRAFVDALDRLGFDVSRILGRAGLHPADLDDPDGVIPCSAQDLVMSFAFAERRLPNLGAHMGDVTPIGTFALLDYLVVTSDTVGDALEQLTRLHRIIDAPLQCTIAEDTDDLVRFVVHSTASSDGTRF